MSTRFPAALRIRISSYRYRGPHANFNRATRRVERGHRHWDWRYKITWRGQTVRQQQAFCTWEGALESALRNAERWAAILK
jgi:hypothetical protein